MHKLNELHPTYSWRLLILGCSPSVGSRELGATDSHGTDGTRTTAQPLDLASGLPLPLAQH